MLIDEYTRGTDNSENQENNTKTYKAQRKLNNSEHKRVNNYCSHCKMKNQTNKKYWFLKGKTIIHTHKIIDIIKKYTSLRYVMRKITQLKTRKLKTENIQYVKTTMQPY